ncbi:MAG TPA: inositol monophosphatase family protein [Clostridia bacterium]|nr:inositol monophosphatase family protein [Clostridia bacterium]
MSQIAREAGALLMSFFERRIGFEYKGDVDLVTEADRASEKLIVERLHETWPEHSVVGEEGTRKDSGSDFRWYVDPLDGTTNFAHGYPVFCVSLGLVHKGGLKAGVLYDPTRDELFSAEKGSGAFLNGRPIEVSKTKTLSESILATGFPSHKRHQNPNIHFYHQLTLRSHGIRRAGSAALDLANVSAGRYDGFWEFNLNPWDTTAGVLLVQEAGGTVTRFDGSQWAIDSRETLASNGILHEELMRNFAEIFAGRGLEDLPSPAEYARTRQK